MEIKELSLLSLTNCPHCHTAKIILDKYKIKYKDINWDLKENEALFEELHITHVPVLLVPNKDGFSKIEGEININNWARNHVN
jgi:glutaredoxin